MEYDLITRWGAVVGAAAGTFSLWIQVRDRWDKIFVGVGSLRQSISPALDFYIRNCGKQSTYIRDYGLVLPNGELFSIPFSAELEGPGGSDPDDYVRGERELAPYQNLEVGFVTSRDVVGAWAWSATASRPTVTAISEGSFLRSHAACWRARLFPRYV